MTTKNQLPTIKRFISISILVLLLWNVQAQQSYFTQDYSYEVIPSFSEEEVKSRVASLNLCIPPKYDNIVKSYVNTYMVKDRDKARAIIGRTVQFFPIFEKYIAEKGLPKDLKYVSVLESALNPAAESRSKAVGLWQFMEATAKGYDLQVNSTVDERKDPHRATQAALRYLQRLHDRYGDWALALAAYNGGPGRVNRAIKRGRSKNFWSIQKYLPKETRNYIPAFFAAAYLINYYQDHAIAGDYPDLDMQLTDVVKVYRTLSFEEIAQIAGVPYPTIEALNPSYKKRIIPSSPRGNYLILPQRVMGTFMQYLKYPDSQAQATFASSSIQVQRHPNDYFYKTRYVVQQNDNIHTIASVFKCSSYNIRAWNGLGSDYLADGQELTIYQPFISTEYNSEFYPNTTTTKIINTTPTLPKPILRKYETVSIATLPLENIGEQKAKESVRSIYNLTSEKYLYYRMVKGESLTQVAAKFPGVNLEDILVLNDFPNKKQRLKPGSRIKIKPL